MKAKSRKRLLISSVAMLLVAMLALGTATFAWFTTSPTANASGVILKATASQGLKVLTESHKTAAPQAEYLSSDYLNYDSTTQISSTTAKYLNPASYAFTVGSALGTPFKTTADSDTAYNADTSAEVAPATAGWSGTNDVYAEKIYCKLVGASSSTDTAALSLTSVSISNVTAEAYPMINSMRVIITYNGDVKGAYALQAVNGEVTLSAVGTPNTYENATKSTGSFTQWTSASNVALGSVGTSGNDYVGVHIYLDGEDTNCKSSNIKVDNLFSNITVNLAIPTT